MRRRIMLFGNYFMEFYQSLTTKEARKVDYILSQLELESRVASRFVRHIKEHGNLYELRMEYESNIYRCSSYSMRATSWCCSTDSRRRHKKRPRTK